MPHTIVKDAPFSPSKQPERPEIVERPLFPNREDLAPIDQLSEDTSLLFDHKLHGKGVDGLSYATKIQLLQQKLADVFLQETNGESEITHWLKGLMIARPSVAAGILKAILPKQVEIDSTAEVKKAPLVINIQNNIIPQQLEHESENSLPLLEHSISPE